MQHSGKVFSLQLLHPILLNVLAKCNGCLETLPFADHTTIYVQQKTGLLPETSEDSLS